MTKTSTISRRTFVQRTAATGMAASAGLSLARSAHAQGSGTIKIGLVGSGGRGLGAAMQALSTGKDVRIVAIGDYFKERAKNGANAMREHFSDQTDLPENRIFDGFENDKGVIGSDVDVVLIACAAKFHPLYMKRAVEAGKHVFVEKPHAIDAQGIHTLEAAVRTAREKKLSVLSGLHSRYCAQNRALVEKVHSGAIGEVKMIQSSFLRSPYGVRGYPAGMSELDVQVFNQYMFRWLGGDDFTQSLVHNVDRMTWLLNGELPTHAVGMGGRASMTAREFGDVFDHHAAIFHYANDARRLVAVCRTEIGCYDLYDDMIIGTKGNAYWNAARITGENPWKFSGTHEGGHQEEQTAFYKALRNGERIDSGDYMINSTLMAILGQVVCYTGQMTSWQEMYDSKFCFKPLPEECVAGMAPPVKPDPTTGSYPVPIPGQHTWWG